MPDKIDFRRASFTYFCAWARRERTGTFKGACIVCGVRTFEMDDGQNDPRGILGRHAGVGVNAHEHGHAAAADVEHPACFECMNEERTYLLAIERAAKRSPGLRMGASPVLLALVRASDARRRMADAYTA